MPTNGPNGIQIQIDGDATPLISTVEKAKAKIEADAASQNIDSRKSAIKSEIDATTDSFVKMQTAAKNAGEATDNAVGPTSQNKSSLKDLNKTLSDTVGQVQSLFAKFTMVVGVATGMYALGKAIREGVVDALESGAEKAKKFSESLSSTKTADNLAAITKQIEELQGKLAVAMEEAETAMNANLPISAMMKQNLVNQLEDELKSLRQDAKILQADANAATQAAKRDKDKAAADANLKELNALRTAAMREAMDEETRIVAEAASKRAEIVAKHNAATEEERKRQAESTLAALNAIYETELKQLDAVAAKKAADAERDAERKRKEAEDARKEQERADEELRKWAEDSQRKADDVRRSWENSFRQIREASNAAFNVDNARTMVELAGQLNATATTATANMNRIIVGGTD